MSTKDHSVTKHCPSCGIYNRISAEICCNHSCMHVFEDTKAVDWQARSIEAEAKLAEYAKWADGCLKECGSVVSEDAAVDCLVRHLAAEGKQRKEKTDDGL